MSLMCGCPSCKLIKMKSITWFSFHMTLKKCAAQCLTGGGKYSSFSVWYIPLWWTFSALISSFWIQIHWNVKHPYNPSWKNKKLFLIYYLVSLSSLTASFKFSNTGGLCLRSATVYHLCKIIECMSEWVGPVDTIDCACAVSLRGCGLLLIMLQGQISVTHTYIVRWHCDICFFLQVIQRQEEGRCFILMRSVSSTCAEVDPDISPSAACSLVVHKGHTPFSPSDEEQSCE